MNKPSFGSDPEVMLYDKHLKRVVSAIPILKQNKEDPVLLQDGVKTYYDNVMVEAAFPPVETRQDFVRTVGGALGLVQKFLGPRYQLLCQAAAIYDESELANTAAILTGCNPNLDVYSGTQNEPVKFVGGLRTGSFHLHIGHEKLADFHLKEALVMLLDIYLGCASVIFDKDETALTRRSLYGKAGEFRSTPYGIEYRVLGNWSLRSPLLVGMIWDLASHAISLIENDTAIDLIGKTDMEMVQEAINGCHRDLADMVLGTARVPMPLWNQMHDATIAKVAW